MVKYKYRKVDDTMAKTRTKYNDCWMYILLLSTLVILTESLKNFNFNIFQAEITYAIFLIPVIYAITNYITKKYSLPMKVVIQNTENPSDCKDAAYTEAGGSMLEFQKDDDIDHIMTNMRQGGFTCNKEK